MAVNFDDTLNELSPFSLSSDSNDSYTMREMLRQPDKAEFIAAMGLKVNDHVTRNHWKMIKKTQMKAGVKPILGIWSFKRKRKPDGEIIKYKARLCAHGGMTQWGINYCETFSPVVNWMSIRMLLILAVVFNLPTECIDFTLAFPQATLDVDIYMSIPQGFNVDEGNRKDYVLKLIKSLYGLKDASRRWFTLLSESMMKKGRDFKQSAIDLCVFFKEDIIVLVYVDDCMIIGRDKACIDKFIKSMEKGEECFSFTREMDLKTYLGVDVKRDKNKIHLTQPYLTQRIVEALNLTTCLPKPNPVRKPVLQKDVDGEGPILEWHYRSVVGMLNYLTKTTRPDIAMAVYQVSRFCQNPRRSHEQAVRLIGKYLKGTMQKGLIFTPDPLKGI